MGEFFYIDSERIDIQPQYFKETSSLDTLHNKWFVNLSDSDIPLEVKLLLQLGEKFGLPINKNNKEKTLVTKKFISDHPNLLITNADKGSVTVILDNNVYIEKMEEILSDLNTYEKITNDPTKKVTRDLRVLLVRWKRNGFIDDVTYRRLLTIDGVIPRAYGLTKIHKDGNPLRVIVSSINGALYALSLSMHNIINDSIPKTFSHIKDSFQLVEKLNGRFVDPGYVLASLDVVSLFTNTPTDLALNSIDGRWEHISAKTCIPKSEFIIAVRFILGLTFFAFNKKIYKQVFGTPMGSPLSPIIADMVLQDLEKSGISKLRVEPLFYFRYVDDIILALPSDNIIDTLNTFNSLHIRLQFTLKIPQFLFQPSFLPQERYNYQFHRQDSITVTSIVPPEKFD
ncbi:PREDICTED: uncharacterized protein LOC108760020 [Trachymyrmex cornetzi]|uniref:uncharacterized protein LOC108760020 n=1 Tax=Trachymyrmex cornetzi TaxID=471704 RepID=UPI00084F779F|nr:PREDICTED: uncharacterized protein LOC108760020 [Trachymyrmex cornetzi]